MSFYFSKAINNLPPEIRDWVVEEFIVTMTKNHLNTNAKTGIRMVTPESFVKKLIGRKQRRATEKVEVPNNNNKYGDYRFKLLYLNAFRGIPMSKDGTAYGINLTSSKEPQYSNPSSCIILGTNGVGKTSLYNALELFFTGKLSVAEKRGFSAHYNLKERSFIGNIRSQETISSITVDTVSKKLVWNERSEDWKLLSDLELAPCFTSDSDIHLFEMSRYEIDDYIDKQFGFDVLIKSIAFLNNAIDEVKKHISLIELSYGNSKNKETIKLKDKCADLRNSIYFVLERLKSHLTKELRRNQIAALKDAEETIRIILKDYLDDGVELSTREIENPDTHTKETLINGKLKLDGKEIEPKIYFNNFRFKLYVIVLRAAISLHRMKIFGLKFPLVFDDVFDSSDFVNRTQARVFIESLINRYRATISSGTPLQIIFFTQDEVVANALYKGIAHKSENGNVKLLRLSHVSDIDPMKDRYKASDEIEYLEMCDVIMEHNDISHVV